MYPHQRCFFHTYLNLSESQAAIRFLSSVTFDSRFDRDSERFSVSLMGTVTFQATVGPMRSLRQVYELLPERSLIKLGRPFNSVIAAIIQYIVCQFIRHEATVQNPDQASLTKRHMKQYFFGKFLAKTRRVNNNSHKKFKKKPKYRVVNGNTQLLSDWTDNQFYTSAERICCVDLRLTYRRCRFWQKKNSSFEMKLFLILASM